MDAVSVAQTTLGALFLCMFATSVLFGVTCVQSHEYTQRTYNDTWILQATVGALWTLEALVLGFGINGLYSSLITSYSIVSTSTSHEPVWTIAAAMIASSLTYALASAVYAWRIWTISKGLWLISIPPLALCTTSSGLALATASRSFRFGLLVEINKLNWMLYATYATAVAGNLCVFSAMCYFLYKSRSGVRRDSLVNQLLVYGVNTNFVTFVGHIVALTAYASMQSEIVHIGIYLLASALCCNSLLATLNSRERLLRRDDHSLPLENVSTKNSMIDRFAVHKQPSRTSRLLSALSLGRLPSPVSVDTTIDKERYIHGTPLERTETNFSHGDFPYAKAL